MESLSQVRAPAAQPHIHPCLLQSDILGEITSYLDVQSLCQLSITGNLQLMICIRQGGVQSIQHQSYRTVWPNVIFSFPKLHSLSVVIDQISPVPKLLAIELHRLPKCLNSLRLVFAGSSRLILALPPHRRLRDLFPELRSLIIIERARECPNTDLHEDFALSLPTCLEKLQLTRGVLVPPPCLEHLPRSITDLTVVLKLSPSDKLPTFSPILTHLTLSTMASPLVEVCQNLPPTLQALSISKHRLQKRETDENIKRVLTLLPHSLTLLNLMGLEFTWTEVHFALLQKRSLISLHLSGSLDEQLAGTKLGALLPKTLSYFTSPSSTSVPYRSAFQLPRSLVRWQNMFIACPPEYVSSEVNATNRDPAPIPHVVPHGPHIVQLPPNMRHLQVNQLHDYAVSLLPPSLASLVVGNCLITEKGWSMVKSQCNRLTDLNIAFQDLPEFGVMASLPPTLQVLQYTLFGSCAHPREPLGPVPPALTMLTLGISHFPASTLAWNSLPSTLQCLSLSCGQVDLDLLKYLPQKLISLMIGTRENAEEIHDTHISLLPRSLTYLRLTGLKNMISIRGVAEMPRSLTECNMKTSPEMEKALTGPLFDQLVLALPPHLYWIEAYVRYPEWFVRYSEDAAEFLKKEFQPSTNSLVETKDVT